MAENVEDGFTRAGDRESGTEWTKEMQETDKVLRGFYVNKKENIGPNDSNIYQIQVDGDETTTDVWGTTVLDKRFEEVSIGDEVIIEFLGLKTPKSGGKPYRNYDVQYRTPVGEKLDGDDLKAAQEALPDPKDV